MRMIATLLICYIAILKRSIQRFNDLTIQRFNAGFTMIELLIVLTILGVATTLISASYLGFEKRERVKSAALEVKNQIRFAQNRALSGDKGIPNDPAGFCDTSAGQTLVGWYVNVDTASQTSYFIAGDCLTSSTESTFAQKSTRLPDGVTITSLTYDNQNPPANKANILFRPLENGAYFFKLAGSAQFLKSGSADTLDTGKLLGSIPQETVTIRIQGFNTTYDIEVKPTGEVNEKKI